MPRISEATPAATSGRYGQMFGGIRITAKRAVRKQLKSSAGPKGHPVRRENLLYASSQIALPVTFADKRGTLLQKPTLG